jgi:hypothetical protein
MRDPAERTACAKYRGDGGFSHPLKLDNARRVSTPGVLWRRSEHHTEGLVT